MNDKIQPTQWITVSKCFDISETPLNHRLYCGKIKAHFGMQSFVLCLAILLSINYIIIDLPNIPNLYLKIILSAILIIFVSLFIFSYITASYADPGYLPYNWYETQKSWYTKNELLSGIGLTEEQINYAQTHPRPRFAPFSRAFGWFVLRGDHICGWIGNWVGQRNHKQFMLMNLYACLSTLCFLIGSIFSIVNIASEEFLGAFTMVAMFLDGMFMLMCGSMFVNQIMSLAKGTTQVQAFKAQEQRTSNMENLKASLSEICGDDKIWWLIPTNAFDGPIPLEMVNPDGSPIDDVL